METSVENDNLEMDTSFENDILELEKETNKTWDKVSPLFQLFPPETINKFDSHSAYLAGNSDIDSKDFLQRMLGLHRGIYSLFFVHELSHANKILESHQYWSAHWENLIEEKKLPEDISLDLFEVSEGEVNFILRELIHLLPDKTKIDEFIKELINKLKTNSWDATELENLISNTPLRTNFFFELTQKWNFETQKKNKSKKYLDRETVLLEFAEEHSLYGRKKNPLFELAREFDKYVKRLVQNNPKIILSSLLVSSGSLAFSHIDINTLEKALIPIALSNSELSVLVPFKNDYGILLIQESKVPAGILLNLLGEKWRIRRVDQGGSPYIEVKIIGHKIVSLSQNEFEESELKNFQLERD